MPKKITKEQLKRYISQLISWRDKEFKTYVDGLKIQAKSMANEDSSNPPGDVPKPPKH